jgi:MFS family permease
MAASGWRDLAATAELPKFILLCLGVWLHAADSLLVATVMPKAVAEIGGVVFINWAAALYLLGSILAASLAGFAAKQLGLRGAMMAAAACYGIGCAISALSPSMAVMLLGRVLQGLGGGGLMALVYVAIEAIFPERFWPRLLVIVSTIWGASALCGPLIGGLFAEAGLWRWAFWVFAGQALALVAAAGLLLGRRASASTHGTGGAAPVPLALLVAGTLGIAAAGATTGSAWSGVLGLLGLAGLGAFAWSDRRQSRHLLPSGALDLRSPVGNGLLMVLALAAATTPFGTYGPLLLGLLFGTSPLTSGYLVAVEAIAWSVAAAATAELPARREPHLIRCGAGLIALGALGYAVAVPTGSILGIVACLTAQGTGFGIGWAFMVKRIVGGAAPAERGAAAAAVSSMHIIGYAIGAAAAGIVANAAGLAEGVAAPEAHRAALWLFAAFVPAGALGTVAAFRLTRDQG